MMHNYAEFSLCLLYDHQRPKHMRKDLPRLASSPLPHPCSGQAWELEEVQKLSNEITPRNGVAVLTGGCR